MGNRSDGLTLPPAPDRRGGWKKSQHTSRYRRLLAALQAARERAGLTQGEVADRLGTYASFVSKCESGERRLDVADLAAMCELYGSDLMALLTDAGFGPAAKPPRNKPG